MTTANCGGTDDPIYKQGGHEQCRYLDDPWSDPRCIAACAVCPGTAHCVTQPPATPPSTVVPGLNPPPTVPPVPRVPSLSPLPPPPSLLPLPPPPAAEENAAQRCCADTNQFISGWMTTANCGGTDDPIYKQGGHRQCRFMDDPWSDPRCIAACAVCPGTAHCVSQPPAMPSPPPTVPPVVNYYRGPPGSKCPPRQTIQTVAECADAFAALGLEYKATLQVDSKNGPFSTIMGRRLTQGCSWSDSLWAMHLAMSIELDRSAGATSLPEFPIWQKNSQRPSARMIFNLDEWGGGGGEVWAMPICYASPSNATRPSNSCPTSRPKCSCRMKWKDGCDHPFGAEAYCWS